MLFPSHTEIPLFPNKGAGYGAVYELLLGLKETEMLWLKLMLFESPAAGKLTNICIVCSLDDEVSSLTKDPDHEVF